MSNSIEKPAYKSVEPTPPHKDYSFVLETISSKIKAAQARAISSVNHELIEVYRDIGKIIHDQKINAK